MSQRRREYRYDHLTWPEINEAVKDGCIVILPVGATEQHGPHLPLDVDHRLSYSICAEVARRSEGSILVMPPVCYGYCHHVMDFPGTINIQMENFINYCLDITKSVAYHGFKKIVIVNGHGSNEPLVQLIARKTILLTDAVCAGFSWWHCANKAFSAVRESELGGCAHACELETSVYLHLNPDLVKRELIRDELASNLKDEETREWYALDLAYSAPTSPIPWTSTYTDSGVIGRPTLASAEKGKVAFEAAVNEILRFCAWFRKWELPARKDHHAVPPTMDLPFTAGF